MSTAEFASLELTPQTQEAIREMGFVHMTEVQARTIPHLLTGRDVLGAAKTGGPFLPLPRIVAGDHSCEVLHLQSSWALPPACTFVGTVARRPASYLWPIENV